ncbi:MAG: phospholipid carrier-dependent glycosyltransferase [Chloroflexi bacterium]|nr:phospholipid carrier-dependent glycosyltransferase [Chloroflexota bacterium]
MSINRSYSFLQRHLLTMMVLLQLVWLGGVWLTGASASPQKLFPLFVYSLMVGLVFLFFPGFFAGWLIRLEAYLAQNERRLLLILSLTMLIIGLVYAHYQRIWPWDEENSYQASLLVAEGGVTALLDEYMANPWLGAQHPPLMIMLYGSTMRLFGQDIFVVRSVGVFMGVGVLLLTYWLGRELYNPLNGFLAAAFLLSFPLFLRQSATAMTDVPVTFFFSLALLLTWRLLHHPSFGLTLSVAAVIGIGILIKYTMVFIYPVLVALAFFSPSFKHIRRYLAIILLLPMLLGLVWLVLAQNFGILAGQIGTLGSYITVMGRSEEARQFLYESFTTRLPTAVGVYNIPLIALGGYYLLRRQGEAEQFLFWQLGVVWLVLTVTIPDHRYFMLTFPAVAILIARGLTTYTPTLKERALALSLLYGLGALYLFVDWLRTAHLFIS